eukprot:Clim_evm14s77 gene=Clim_evmTU14s77
MPVPETTVVSGAPQYDFNHTDTVLAKVQTPDSEVQKLYDIRGEVTDEDRSADTEKKRAREYFEKLKFALIELETKNQFLQRVYDLKGDGTDDVVSNEERVREVKNAKNQVKVIKKETEECRQQLEELFHNLETQLRLYQESKDDLMTGSERARRAQAELDEVCSQEKAHRVYYKGRLVDHNSAEAILADQWTEMEKLDKEERKFIAQIQELNERIKPLQEEVNRLEVHTKDCEQQQRNKEAEKDLEQVERERLQQRLDMENALLAKWSGFHPLRVPRNDDVVDPEKSKREISYILRTKSERSHRVTEYTVTFIRNQPDGRIIDFQVEPTPDVLMQDILDATLKKNKDTTAAIQFALREINHRLQHRH